jgi:hypothetical protein
MTFLWDDTGIISHFDLVPAEIVEDRRLDGEGGSELGFDGVARDVAAAIADAIEDFAGHLQEG